MMIKTLVDQNENDVFYLHIFHNDKLVVETYNEKTDEYLNVMADIAIEMYELGRDDVYNLVEDKTNDSNRISR